MAPTTALLIASQWQFKFFDVTQVKLPDDESSFLSEVREPPHACFAFDLPLVGRKHNLRGLWFGKHLLR
jgi:hypothetical protein